MRSFAFLEEYAQERERRYSSDAFPSIATHPDNVDHDHDNKGGDSDNTASVASANGGRCGSGDGDRNPPSRSRWLSNEDGEGGADLFTPSPLLPRELFQMEVLYNTARAYHQVGPLE